MSNDTKIDEVVHEIARRIREGEYATGERLPSERDLAEELNVSRPTIRTALLRLQSENTIDIVPKSGIYVRFPRVKTTIGPLRPAHLKHKGAMGIFTALKEQERETQIRYLEPPAIVPAKGRPGIKMNVGTGAEVLRRYYLCLVQQLPYRIVDSYYLADLLPTDVLEKGETLRRADSPLQWLRKYAVQTPPDAYERSTCRMPDANEAELLNINRNQPVVETERWIFVEDGKVFEYSIIIANAALHEFTYTYEHANWDDLVGKVLTGS